MDEATRTELDHLDASLRGWALEDVKRAAAGEAKVGSFILGAHFVDVLARLYTTKNDAKAAWDEFVPRYLPRYREHAEVLYRGFRGAISHHYSADGIRFTDGENNRLRHWTLEAGERVLHLETFLEDLDTAWRTFYRDVCSDAAMRERVLNRARERPPLGVLGGETVHSSVQIAPHTRIMISGFSPTHFGAQAASGASWPTTTDRTFPVEPLAQPSEKTTKPKKRKRKR